MADVRSRNEIVANDGVTYVTFGANSLKHVINQADVGRELIVKCYDSNSAFTDTTLNQIIQYITTSHGTNGSGDSAFTVAAIGTADGTAFVSGTTDTVFLRVQGTGDLTVGTADQSISGVTVSIEAIFAPAK